MSRVLRELKATIHALPAFLYVEVDTEAQQEKNMKQKKENIKIQLKRQLSNTLSLGNTVWNVGNTM